MLLFPNLICGVRPYGSDLKGIIFETLNQGNAYVAMLLFNPKRICQKNSCPL